MKKILISLLLIGNVNAVVYMDVERLPGSGEPSFVTSCPTAIDCYKKFLWAERAGKTQYCKEVKIIRNGKVIWRRDYTTPLWYNQQQRLIWGDD